MSALPMQPNLSRAVMFHPLFDHSVLLPTNAIEDVYRIVKRVVMLRETGCVFTGQSGVGKTDALARIRLMLQADFPGLCTFTHDAHNHEIASIRAFFKHFLTTVGQNEKKGETYDLRSRLIRLLVDESRISGMNLIVMFIDEANAMLLSDFLFLKDVYNDLSREGVQLITVLMGQDPDLKKVINDLRNEGRRDLIARFATRVYWIGGFAGTGDLQVVLREIDQREYPPKSGRTWTPVGQVKFPHLWPCQIPPGRTAPIVG